MKSKKTTEKEDISKRPCMLCNNAMMTHDDDTGIFTCETCGDVGHDLIYREEPYVPMPPKKTTKYIMVTPKRLKDLEWYEEMYEKCRQDLTDEMNTGEQIYESLCSVCKKVAEKIIEEDGVINLWDDMLKDKHKDTRSDVQW